MVRSSKCSRQFCSASLDLQCWYRHSRWCFLVFIRRQQHSPLNQLAECLAFVKSPDRMVCECLSESEASHCSSQTGHWRMTVVAVTAQIDTSCWQSGHILKDCQCIGHRSTTCCSGACIYISHDQRMVGQCGQIDAHRQYLWFRACYENVKVVAVLVGGTGNMLCELVSDHACWVAART